MTLAATVPALLADLTGSRRDEAAVVTPEGLLTYGEWDEQSARLAGRLVLAGARKGTIVALLLPNGGDWVCWWAACARIGAVVVPMNTFATPVEVRRVLHHSGAQLFVAVPSFAANDYRQHLDDALRGADPDTDRLAVDLPQLRRVLWVDEHAEAGATPPVVHSVVDALAADVTPADTLTIIYSSGSTGDPKGVVHAHGAVVRQAARLADLTRTDDTTVLWTSMPLNWVGGLVWSFLRAVVVGGTFVTQARFESSKALRLFSHVGVNTVTAWGPGIEQLLLDPGYSQAEHGHIVGLQRIETGPEARPSALGMTETLGPHAGWFGEPGTDIPVGAAGSLGRALAGVDHRVVEPGTTHDVPEGQPGELLVRADSLMQGLHRHERRDVFTPDGWYRTGDGAALRGGWLFFQGRLDDLIKTAGANVSPAEVQRVLLAHPSVRHAFVVGVPHPSRGQNVAAFVVPDGEPVDEQALIEEARRSLAAYKVPKRIITIAEDEIPWMSSQKVDIRRLQAMAAAW